MGLEDYEAQLDQALESHRAIQRSLALALSFNDRTPPPKRITDPGACAFGLWLAGADLPDTMKNGAPYRRVAELHVALHQRAAEVGHALEQGQTDAAQVMLHGPCKDGLDAFARALDSWRSEALGRQAVADRGLHAA